jgi:hypothetical protein
VPASKIESRFTAKRLVTSGLFGVIGKHEKRSFFLTIEGADGRILLREFGPTRRSNFGEAQRFVIKLTKLARGA